VTVYVDDVVAWLRGREWLVQSGFMPRYHAVLCDPPYGLAFMGQHWDTMTAEQYQAWCTEWATLLLSFVYPGAVLLAFGGTRTFHRLAAGLEDAGWIVADTIAWITGQGFPKSHNGRNWDAGEHWHGYGTALKPAWESVVLARAPWRGTYAALAREFGTGAINVDGGRIQFANNEPYSIDERCRPNTRGTKRKPSVVDYVHEIAAVNVSHFGRWPANLILGCACESAEHDADCPVRLLGEQSGERDGGGAIVDPPSTSALFGGHGRPSRPAMADSGTAARFFFKAKAAAWEREAGLTTRSHHPTMKPIALTEYLARLLLPPPLQEPRRLLIPFAGSGSEMIGAQLAGWDVVDGIEQSADYAAIARARLAWWGQFRSYEQAQSAAGADAREAAEREAERKLGIQQLDLFDGETGTW
jgi:hypothetical protein